MSSRGRDISAYRQVAGTNRYFPCPCRHKAPSQSIFLPRSIASRGSHDAECESNTQVSGTELFSSLPFSFQSSFSPLGFTHHHQQHFCLDIIMASYMDTSKAHPPDQHPSSHPYHWPEMRFSPPPTLKETVDGRPDYGRFKNLPQRHLARVFRIHVDRDGTVGSDQINFAKMLDNEDARRSGKTTVCLVVEGDCSLMWDCNLGRYFHDHPGLERMVRAYLDDIRPWTDDGDVEAVTWWRAVSQIERQYRIHQKISASDGEYFKQHSIAGEGEKEARHCMTRYSIWPTPSGPCRLLSRPGPDDDKRYWHAAEERLFYYEAAGLGKDGQFRTVGECSDMSFVRVESNSPKSRVAGKSGAVPSGHKGLVVFQPQQLVVRAAAGAMLCPGPPRSHRNRGDRRRGDGFDRTCILQRICRQACLGPAEAAAENTVEHEGEVQSGLAHQARYPKGH